MKNQFGIYFWLHGLAVLIAWFSPIILDWKIIIGIAIILQIQYLIINGCFMTYSEFGKGDKDITFVWYYLNKLVKLDKRKFKIFNLYIVPAIVIIVALILQIRFSFKPLLFDI